jgi:hypothetical protein
MGAPVRMEAEVFTDPDVSALQKLLGLEQRATAVGLLAELWSWQTKHYTDEHPTYAVPRSILVGIFGLQGPQAMVDANLATEQPDGRFYIHGTDKPNGSNPEKTRINWMFKGRAEQSARAKKRGAQLRSGVTPGDPEAQPRLPQTPSGSAAAEPRVTSLISDLWSPEEPEHTHPARDPSATDLQPAATPTTDRVATIANGALSWVRRQCGAVAAELGGVFKRGYAIAIESQVRAVVAGWLADGGEDLARERLKQLVAFRVARARSVKHVQFLEETNFWSLESIARDLAQPLANAALKSRGGDGPGGPSRPKTGAAAGADALAILQRRKQGNPP